MAKHRVVDPKFWDDNYIINLDPVEKLMFLYFLTNPLTNLCGIYEISLRRIAFDTGIDKEMVLKILARFEKDGRIAYKNGYVFLKNFVKHQSWHPNLIAGLRRELAEIPEKVLEGFETLWKGSTLNLTILNLTKPNLTQSEVEKKLLKHLETEESIKNPQAYLDWLINKYGRQNLSKLLTIEFDQWIENLEYWQK